MLLPPVLFPSLLLASGPCRRFLAFAWVQPVRDAGGRRRKERAPVPFEVWVASPGVSSELQLPPPPATNDTASPSGSSPWTLVLPAPPLGPAAQGSGSGSLWLLVPHCSTHFLALPSPMSPILSNPLTSNI